jgi:hypothetical protein
MKHKQGGIVDFVDFEVFVIDVYIIDLDLE